MMMIKILFIIHLLHLFQSNPGSKKVNEHIVLTGQFWLQSNYIELFFNARFFFTDETRNFQLRRAIFSFF